MAGGITDSLSALTGGQGFNPGISGITVIFGMVVTLLAIFGLIYGGRKLWQRRQHNLLALIEERRENGVISYLDYVHLYRESGQIKGHFWKKNIRFNPMGYKDIKVDAISGKSFVHFIKIGSDDYQIAKINFESDKAEVLPLENESRLWFVEDYKAAEKRYADQGLLAKFMPIVSLLAVGFVMIILVWIISGKFESASKAAGNQLIVLGDKMTEIATLNRETADINLQLARVLGKVNASIAEVPIG